MTKTDVDGREQFNVIYLHELGPSFLMVLKLTMSTGVSSLDVFRSMHPERFALGARSYEVRFGSEAVIVWFGLGQKQTLDWMLFLGSAITRAIRV